METPKTTARIILIVTAPSKALLASAVADDIIFVAPIPNFIMQFLLVVGNQGGIDADIE